MTIWRKLSLVAIAIMIAFAMGVPIGPLKNKCAYAYPYQFSVYVPIDRCLIDAGAGWIVVPLVGWR